MTHPRIETKIYHPKPRPDLIHRQRLNETLNQGLRNHQRLMLIAAPAGFGKTTQVINWLHAQDEDRLSAWLSLDEDDNDPIRFVDYLLAAVSQVLPEFGKDIQSLLSTPQGLPIKTLSAMIINTLARFNTPIILVLDDYHTITNLQIHELISTLVEKAPAHFQIVITTRIDPPFPLARWRARGWLAELYEADLRFTDIEAHIFLNQTMHLPVTVEDCHTITTRTEGWITGLQLAALSLRNRKNMDAFIRDFSGSHRFVLDYLVEEVLQRESELLRQFLLEVSFLDRFCGDLCDTVLGRSDSQAVLDSIASANLFTIPLDDQRQWYRYHHLFADVLRIRAAKLNPERIAERQRRAAQWFAKKEDYYAAVKYASMAKDFSQVKEYITLVGEDFVKHGRLITLLNWYEQLPDDELRQDARLAVNKAWALFLSGENELTGPLLQIARESLPIKRTDQLIGEIESITSFLAVSKGNYPKALQSAEKALTLLDKEDEVIRAATLLSLGIIYTHNAQTEAAERTLQDAVWLSDKTDNLLAYASAGAELALVHNIRGNNQEGLAVCEQAIDRLQDGFGKPLPIAALNFLIHSLLLYECDQLDAAETAFEKSCELAENAEMRGYTVTLELLRAVLAAARGNPDEAVRIIQHAQHQIPDRKNAEEYPLLLTVEAHFQMQLNALPLVEKWAAQVNWNQPISGGYFGDFAWLTRIRLAIAQHRNVEARQWITALKHDAEAHNLQRRLIALGVLEAIVLNAEGEQESACAILSSAVAFAAPGGYTRIFVEELDQIEMLLKQIRETAPEFVDQILSTTETKASKMKPIRIELIEPLSQREVEVLRLLAAGLTSPEIAVQLTISNGTVRTHIKSIYRKLDVHKRLEAVKRAEDLGIV